MSIAHQNYPDVIIHTGNLLRRQYKNAYFSKNALTTVGHKNQELVSALQHLKLSSNQEQSWNHASEGDFQAVKSEQTEVVISAKIFLSMESEPKLIKGAVEQLKQNLKQNDGSAFKINILILSFPKNFKWSMVKMP